jgi:hypothetical protein
MKLTELFSDPQMKRSRLVIAMVLFILYLVVPIAIVNIKSYSPDRCALSKDCYVFDVEVVELLNYSTSIIDNRREIYGGYYLVESIQGGPSSEFVLYISNYFVTMNLPNQFTGYGYELNNWPSNSSTKINYLKYIEINLEDIKGLFWLEQRQDLYWIYLIPIPLLPIISFSNAVIDPEGIYFNDKPAGFLTAILSFITLIIQILFVLLLVQGIVNKKYTKDQIIFFVSTYFLFCVLLLLPLLSIENADPF